MKNNSYILMLLAALGVSALTSCGSNDGTTKKERNFIKSGIEAYNDSDFVAAATDFNRALNINGDNEKTVFNLATAQLSQGKSLKTSDNQLGAAQAADSLIARSDTIYRRFIDQAADSLIKEFSAYNAGNISYIGEDYGSSIELYKQALRLNPDNDLARENLRLAQLKKQQQDQNQDQDKNDQNQDQQNQRDQQDQQQDQQDQQQNQQQPPKQDERQDQQQQPQQPRQGQMSKENAEQILKAMENAENQTRRKQQDKEKRQSVRKSIEKPW